ncbi:MAG: hypothetical protein K2H46_00320 [Muribaculaceae bacterium]|nr:hypothetical protein [Muribaculaceae bacterium]
MFTTSNSSTKSWILLVVAIAVTVLFMVFAEPVFTTFFIGSDNFADAMYDFNLYFSIATYISIIVWVFAILYYWVIDQVKLSSFVGWALFFVLAVAAAPTVTYFYSLSVFEAENLEFMSDLPGFAIITVPIALVEYVIVSLGIKDFSTNCSTRPF